MVDTRSQSDTRRAPATTPAPLSAQTLQATIEEEAYRADVAGSQPDATHDGTSMASPKSGVGETPVDDLEKLRARLDHEREKNNTLAALAEVYEERYGEELSLYPPDVAVFVRNRQRREQSKRRRSPSGSEEEGSTTQERNGRTPSTTAASLALRSRVEESEEEEDTTTHRAKVVEPANYQGKSLAELTDYNRTCKRAFDYQPTQFKRRRDKVTWAAMYIKGAPAREWEKYTKEGGSLDIEWDTYIEFFRNLISHASNRGRTYAMKYQTARQLPDQGIRAFLNYMEELEDQLEPYTETQKVEHLLTRIHPEMHQRLVENGFLLQERTRQELVNQIALLEENTRVTRVKDKRSNDYRRGDQYMSRANSQQKQEANPNEIPIEKDKPRIDSYRPSRGDGRNQDTGDRQDTYQQHDGPPRPHPRRCYNCGEEGHIARDCRRPRK